MVDIAIADGVARRRSVARSAATDVTGEHVAVVATGLAVVFLPLAVPTGPANTAPADLFIGVALAASLLWATAARHRWGFPFVIPVAIFMAGGAVGGLIGPLPGHAIVALIQDAVLLLWCWTVSNVCRSPSNLRFLMRTWAYSSIAWAVTPIVGLLTGSAALTGQTENQGSRVQITLADPSYAANYFFISIMVIWATQCPRRRPFRIAAYALLVTGILLTGSNSGALSLAVGTVIAAVVGLYRRFGSIAAITAFSFIVLAGFVIASNVSLSSIQDQASGSRYAFIRDGLGRDTSVQQRGMLLHESLTLYREGNPLGEGPVTTKVRLEQQGAPFQKEAHDDYIAALIERGVIGFVGLLLLVAALLGRTGGIAVGRLKEGFAAAVPRPNALLGAVVGTLVAGAVYELLHVRHVWGLFGLVAGLYAWGRQ
jgi:hypothetical protein